MVYQVLGLVHMPAAEKIYYKNMLLLCSHTGV